jgi:hypothetical protein
LATVNIDSKLLEALQQSTCFGIAHDDEVPECKQCDVKGQCKAKSEGGSIPTPTLKPKKPSVSETKTEKPKATAPKKPATKPSTTTKPKATTPTPAKPKATASGDLPDFKPMTLPQLEDLARERNVEWKDYGNDSITRMRLIMALKKSY